MWRKKQIGRQQYQADTRSAKSEESLSISDHSSSEDERVDEEKREEKNDNIQEKLITAQDRIKIQTMKSIKTEKYSELFKYKIYDGYLTETLAQTRQYFKYIQAINMQKKA